MILRFILLTLFRLVPAPEIDIDFNPESNREVTETRLYRFIGGQWVEMANATASTSAHKTPTGTRQVALSGKGANSGVTLAYHSYATTALPSSAPASKSRQATKRFTTPKNSSIPQSIPLQTLSLDSGLNPRDFLESLVSAVEKGRPGTYKISAPIETKEMSATNLPGASLPPTSSDEPALLYRNVVCLGDVVTTTVCCTGPESSRDYLVMLTPRQIPCDTKNCVETCQLVKSIPGYEGFSLKSDEDYFDAIKLVKRTFVEESTQDGNDKSGPIIANSQYFVPEKDLNVDSNGDSELSNTRKRESANSKIVPDEIVQFLDLCKLMLDLQAEEKAKGRKVIGGDCGGNEVSGEETSTGTAKARKSLKCRWGGGGESNFSPKPFAVQASSLAVESSYPSSSQPAVSIDQTPPTLPKQGCPLNQKQWKFLIDFIDSHLCTAETDSSDQDFNSCRPTAVSDFSATSQTKTEPTTRKTSSNVSTTTHKTKRPTTSKMPNHEWPRPITSNASFGQYLNYLGEVASKVTRKMKLAAWDFETNINHETRKKSMITSIEATQFQKRLNNELIKLRQEISDSTYARQIKLLHAPGVSVLPDVKITEFDQVVYAIQTIYQSAVVGRWKSQTEKVPLTPYIKQVMADSDNPEEMLYYWLEWRKMTGRRVKSLFEQYVEIVNQSASLNGFTDAGEMWTAPFETEDFQKLLASEMEEVIPLYKQLHAYVRHSLHHRYGNIAGAYDTGPIPAHLTGDIFGQSWKHVYRFVVPYSTARNSSKVDLEGHKYNVERMARDAERMFHSLGFDNLPPLFWTRSKFFRLNETNEDCTPSAWDMGADNDFRVKFCGESTMEDFATIHKLIAQVEYFMSFSKQPFPFRAPANPGFMDAVSGAILLSARSRKHLETLGLEEEDLRDDPQSRQEDEINFLMEMALEKVASLPYAYVLDLWRSKVFQGEITSDEYTSSWWQLRERYQGVASPVHRTEEDFDVGANSRVVASEPFIKDFVSNIMEFQFHESLCTKAGHTGPLHSCDISSSPTAGYYLRNVMSLGASEHWRVAMKKLTGQRKMSARPLLRYFQPLNEWLQMKNRAERHHIGWERS